MSHQDKPAPLGGPLFTRTTLVLLALAVFGFTVVGWRFAVGLGRSTDLSDGFPWGIWIAYDVVTGTALACGGYAMAILVYVFNKGRYHALVRPALLTSVLGYTLAALSVLIDVGRPWNAWNLMLPWRWNTNSVLLEVAICIMSYTVVLWIELAPAFLEGFQTSRSSLLRTLSGIAAPLEKALPFILALGLLLPTMHQSSLGSLLLLARTKVHPLWHTPLLPLLFLISVVGMGYAVVVLEGAISSLALRRKPETRMLGKIAQVLPALGAAWIVIRVADLALRGRLGLIFASGGLSVAFLLEIALMATASLLLLSGRGRELSMSEQFRAAILFLLAGVLYRFDAFLVAFNPGPQWHYFPSVPEILVTLGIIATEILGYVLIAKRFPIMTGLGGASGHANHPTYARGVA